ncbi:MAG: YhcH/YjgK/YiaL family protein [Bacillota bacterium]
MYERFSYSHRWRYVNIIYGNINNQHNKSFYHRALVKALEVLKKTDFPTMNTGDYEIDGKSMFMRVVNLTTKKLSEALPETHERYVDLQFLIKGREKIYFSLETPKNIVKCDTEKDHTFYDKLDGEGMLEMKEEDFAVFFQGEVHMSGVTVGEPCQIKKVIVKISNELFCDPGKL